MDEDLVMANKIVAELKRLKEFIHSKEDQLAKSSAFKSESKLYNFEITVNGNTWDVCCNSIDAVSDQEDDHLICIKDNEIIAEFWGVQAWVRSDLT